MGLLLLVSAITLYDPRRKECLKTGLILATLAWLFGVILFGALKS